MEAKSVSYSLSIALLCAYVTSIASGQKQTAPQVLPKPEQALVAVEFEKSLKEHPPIAPGTPDPYTPPK